MIFKFFKPSPLSITMLRRAEIFFAIREELNDSNELQANYVFNGKANSWFRLSRLILHEAAIAGGVPDAAIVGNSELDRLTHKISAKAYTNFRRRDVSLTEIKEFISKEINDLSKTIEVKGALKGGLPKILEVLIPQELQQRAAITSFSKTATNPVVWGHYADGGRGFGLIYCPTDNKLEIRTLCDSNITGLGRRGKKPVVIAEHTFNIQLEKVIYRKSPPKLNGFHLLSYQLAQEPGSFDLHDTTLYFKGINIKDYKASKLIKHPAWRYEEEVRSFLPFSLFRANESATRIAEVSARYITGIILGPEMTKRDTQSCLRALEMLRNHAKGKNSFGPRLIPIFKAQRRADSLDFEIVPFAGITGGNHTRRYEAGTEGLKPRHRRHMDDLCLQINRKD